MPTNIPDLVEDFGASPSNTAAQNDLAIRNAIAQCGDVLHIPPLEFPISDTIAIEKRTGFRMFGNRGLAVAGTPSGARFRWYGADGGLMVLLNQVSRSGIDGIGLRGKSSGSGPFTVNGILHVNDSPVVIGGGGNTFRDVNIGRCNVGIQNGRAGQNQPNLGEVDLWNLELTSCNDGMLFQSDQGGNWRFYGLSALSCGNAVRTGDGWSQHDRGHFTVFTGSMGNNNVDFNLPNLSYNVEIYRVTSELANTAFLLSDPISPAAYYRVLLEGCKVTPKASTNGKVMRFRQVYNLSARDCWFSGPVEIGNAYSNPAQHPMREFTDCWMGEPVLLDTANPYEVSIKSPHRWDNLPSDAYLKLYNPNGLKFKVDWNGNVSGKSWTTIP